MWMEGLIDKSYAEAMTRAGWEFDWYIEDQEQVIAARDKGLDVPDLEGDDIYVRFYLDQDIEKFFPAEDVVDNIEEEELPLLLDCKNQDIIKAVEKRLKGR